MEIGLSLVFQVSCLDKIQFNETMEATKQEPNTFVMIIQWGSIRLYKPVRKGKEFTKVH